MTLQFRGPTAVPVALQINGRRHEVCVEPRRTLLSVLRDELGLNGTKYSCGRGECGACTVIMDGDTVYACMKLAIDCEGHAIRTIESVNQGGELHSVQQAFIEHDGYQCGFCTPGQIMSAVSLLEHQPQPTEQEVRHEMAGNLCRCGAYPNILKAILAAAKKAR